MVLKLVKQTGRVIDVPAGWVARWPEDYSDPPDEDAPPAEPPATERARGKKPATSGRKR